MDRDGAHLAGRRLLLALVMACSLAVPLMLAGTSRAAGELVNISGSWTFPSDPANCAPDDCGRSGNGNDLYQYLGGTTMTIVDSGGSLTVSDQRAGASGTGTEDASGNIRIFLNVTWDTFHTFNLSGTVAPDGQKLQGTCPHTGGNPYDQCWTYSTGLPPTQSGPWDAIPAQQQTGTISGTVSDTNCSSTCTLTGMPGVKIVAAGTSKAGASVTQNATTQANGNYSITVPVGTYSVGPSPTGSAIDGKGFDPTQRDAVSVTSAGAAAQNFQACTVSETAQPTILAARDDARSAATAAPSPCRSLYTVTVAAKIPQAQLADPSNRTTYQLGGNGGYNPRANSGLHVSESFPACVDPKLVHKWTDIGATASWYTYIVGGKLPSVTATFAYDRKDGEVQLVDETESHATLTRMFRYEVRLHNKVLKVGHCAETNPAPMLVLSAGGADHPGGSLKNNDFAIAVAWGFPFVPLGAQVDPTTLYERTKAGALTVLKPIYHVVERYDRAIEALVGLAPGIKHIPKVARHVLEFGASYLLGTAAVKALGASPGIINRVLSKWKYVQSAAAVAARLAHSGHYVHDANSFRELINLVSAFAADGEYPVMGAVVRGDFSVSGYQETNTANLGKVPIDSMLGLSVQSTKFPTISVRVSRDAAPNLDPANVVTRGPLPWASVFTKQLDIHNKLSSNPAYVVTNGAGNFGLGEHGVHAIHANTSQLPKLTEAWQEHQEVASEFDPEIDEAAAPSCEPGTALGGVGTYVCYQFNDGRP